MAQRARATTDVHAYTPPGPAHPTAELLVLADFCKGLAIAGIVLVHAVPGWFGWQGVHVFLVLGGFTLAASRLSGGGREPWGRWLTRRLRRVAPAYWAVAVAGFVAMLAFSPFAADPGAIRATALRQLTLDVTFARNFQYATMFGEVNAALWYVPLLLGLYLVFPVVYDGIARDSGHERRAHPAQRVALWLGAAIAVELVYRVAAVTLLDGMPVGYGHGMLRGLRNTAQAMDRLPASVAFQKWAPFGLFPSRVGEFALGIAAAFTVRDRPTLAVWLLGWRGILSSLAAWAIGSALVYRGPVAWIGADLLIAAGLTGLTLALAKRAATRAPRIFALVSRLGVWSLYLFLVHLLAGYVTARLYAILRPTSPLAIIALFAGAIVLTVVGCRLLRALDRSLGPRDARVR